MTFSTTLCTCTTTPCPEEGVNKLIVGNGTTGVYVYELTSDRDVPRVAQVDVLLQQTDLDHGSDTSSCTQEVRRGVRQSVRRNVY